MPKLKVLSGKALVQILGQFGFIVVSQKGSHAKLVRTTRSSRQTLTIPVHPELDRGTLMAIYRQASRFIPENELSLHFYTQE